ncbi:hypothetical protein Ate01nite_66960 [Actinoplanes teichomyceticus]|nr:transposase [Actinoplanes teichomyceticus]GIF16664.1 hypothetical protein Ate01nite_66960 [Actinoplanes teichomyceticus]
MQCLRVHALDRVGGAHDGADLDVEKRGTVRTRPRRSPRAAPSPGAIAKITEDRDELLAFYGFPAEHRVHVRTTNPIESTSSTVELRTKVTRAAGSPAAALALVFTLVESAQERRRAITGAHLVALVRPGVRFENGFLVERDKTVAP